jgi:hypothetical protein
VLNDSQAGRSKETEFMHRIHSGIVAVALVSAAGLAALSALALSTKSAQADEWCGYATHDDAVVECGYTTSAECESAVGKGGMCFVDPDMAQNARRMTLIRPARPVLASQIPRG